MSATTSPRNHFAKTGTLELNINVQWFHPMMNETVFNLNESHSRHMRLNFRPKIGVGYS
jgi:hypothetical protein